MFAGYPRFSLQTTHVLRVYNVTSIHELSQVKPAENDNAIYEQHITYWAHDVSWWTLKYKTNRHMRDLDFLHVIAFLLLHRQLLTATKAPLDLYWRTPPIIRFWRAPKPIIWCTNVHHHHHHHQRPPLSSPPKCITIHIFHHHQHHHYHHRHHHHQYHQYKHHTTTIFSQIFFVIYFIWRKTGCWSCCCVKSF